MLGIKNFLPQNRPVLDLKLLFFIINERRGVGGGASSSGGPPGGRAGRRHDGAHARHQGDQHVQLARQEAQVGAATIPA